MSNLNLPWQLQAIFSGAVMKKIGPGDASVWPVIHIDTATNQQPQQSHELLELLDTLQSRLDPKAGQKLLQPRCTHSWKALLSPHNPSCEPAEPTSVWLYPLIIYLVTN